MPKQSSGSVVREIVWSEQALGDAEEIRAFIARDSPSYADLFVDRLLASADRLQRHPHSGRVVPEFARADLREVLLGNYRVIHQVSDTEIAIVTVFHMARLLNAERLPPPH